MGLSPNAPSGIWKGERVEAAPPGNPHGNSLWSCGRWTSHSRFQKAHFCNYLSSYTLFHLKICIMWYGHDSWQNFYPLILISAFWLLNLCFFPLFSALNCLLVTHSHTRGPLCTGARQASSPSHLGRTLQTARLPFDRLRSTFSTGKLVAQMNKWEEQAKEQL